MSHSNPSATHSRPFCTLTSTPPQVYDASVSYVHNARPYLSISEVNLNLPSTELEWGAESAESWVASRPKTGTPHQQNLRQLLRTLFDDGSEQPLNDVRVASHRSLAACTLVRMIWTTKEILGNPVHDLVSDQTNYFRATELISVLDLFLESPLANRDLRTQMQTTSLVRQLSLIHIGHLYGAGDLMNWLYPLLRSSDVDGTLRRRMQQWKADSPSQVRDATYHAAQIMGLAHQFADHGPYQVFAVFHAGVVLFYLAELLREPGETPGGSMLGTPYRDHLQLDFLGPASDDQAIRIRQWVVRGSPAVIGLHGIPDLCSPQGRPQVLEKTADMLSRMQLVWGVAENLRRVVLRLRDLN
jgi:hypothetical protein